MPDRSLRTHTTGERKGESSEKEVQRRTGATGQEEAGPGQNRAGSWARSLHMAPRPGSPTPTLAEHAARRNRTSLPSLFLPPAAPPPSGRAAIGQQSPRRAAPLARRRGPGRDTPTGFPMAGLGWTGWGREGDGMGRGGFPRPGPPGGREGPHAGDEETEGWGPAAWHAPGFPRPHAPGTSAPLPVPADLGGKESGKGDRVRGARAPLPPPHPITSARPPAPASYPETRSSRGW